MDQGIGEVRAQALPQDKACLVAALRDRGAVAMVGDGVNDAGALAAADLGLAMAFSSLGVVGGALLLRWQPGTSGRRGHRT